MASAEQPTDGQAPEVPVQPAVDPLLPLNESFYDNPYQYFHRLRDKAPIHWSEPIESWVVTSYDAVNEAVKNPHIVASRGDTYFGMLPPEDHAELRPLQNFFDQWLLFSDPPYHTRIRKLAAPAFTPKSVSALQEHITTNADQLLEQAKARGSGMEAIADYTSPLSISAISETLGVSVDDYDKVMRWTNDIIGFMGTGRPDVEHGRAAMRSLGELREFLDTVFKEKREHPQDDLITALLQATDNGETLSEDELIATVANILVDGHEPSSMAMTNGIISLCRNPAQFALLQADPTLARSATEEILRCDPPFTYLGRRTTRPITLGDVEIPQDQRVILMLGGANRDPRQFANPDTFDITRQPNRHLTFGHGAHHCIGSLLARTTITTGITKLAEHLDSLSLADDSVNWRQSLGMRAVSELHIQ
jgi:pimeloyl-[acyl-carrier protein] synthase